MNVGCLSKNNDVLKVNRLTDFDKVESNLLECKENK